MQSILNSKTFIKCQKITAYSVLLDLRRISFEVTQDVVSI